MDAAAKHPVLHYDSEGDAPPTRTPGIQSRRAARRRRPACSRTGSRPPARRAGCRWPKRCGRGGRPVKFGQRDRRLGRPFALSRRAATNHWDSTSRRPNSYRWSSRDVDRQAVVGAKSRGERRETLPRDPGRTDRHRAADAGTVAESRLSRLHSVRHCPHLYLRVWRLPATTARYRNSAS